MKQIFHLLVHLTFLFILSKRRHTPTQNTHTDLHAQNTRTHAHTRRLKSFHKVGFVPSSTGSSPLTIPDPPPRLWFRQILDTDSWMTRHLAPLREPELLPPLNSACSKFTTLTYKVQGRNRVGNGKCVCMYAALCTLCACVCVMLCGVCVVLCGGVVWCCVAASDFENMGENRCKNKRCLQFNAAAGWCESTMRHAVCHVSGEMCGVRQGHVQLPAGDSPSFKQGSQAKP